MQLLSPVALTLSLALVGCHAGAHVPSPAKPVTAALSGVAGVEAHTQSAQRHVQNAVPHADPEGKVLLRAASEEHQEVLADTAEVKVALSEASRQVASLQDRISNEQDRYAHLAGQWYVLWGLRIERALWLIGVSWLLCGIASVVLGLGNPLSLTWRVGKEITRLLPAMNLFSWVRDWLLQRRQADGSDLSTVADRAG